MDDADGGTSAVDGTEIRRPRSLTRAEILDTAMALVDRDGIEQLTMRRLGAACGVEAMALYRHVHGRQDLLGGVVDYVVDQLYDDQLAARRQEDGWQDYLVRLAHGVRAIAIDHPHLFPTLATRPPEAPWVRPPLRSLRWMETFLDTLISYGFSDEAAVTAYRAYTTFLLGHLLLEVSARGASLSPVEDDLPAKPPSDLSHFPHLLRMQAQLSEDHTASEFEEALEALIDRLEPAAPRP
ncbi:MAG: TetR/AcrR family transcriptional regulator C-terminal domain-containing protein [Mycobacterium sp.]